MQDMIHCTGVNTDLAAIPFRSEAERILGYALGTADLLGQMAARDYVEKLPALHIEFAEAAHSAAGLPPGFIYASARDLMRDTPKFWARYVRPTIENRYGGLYAFLNDPYPDGPNAYVQRIEANIARLQRMASV